jgi:hypothetical protein
LWLLWRGVARGANATIVWSSKDVVLRDGATTGGIGAPLAPWAQRLAVGLLPLEGGGERDEAAEGRPGAGAALSRAHPLDEGVLVLLSQPSVQVRWMLDSVDDGATWMRRFGSHEAAHSTAIRSRDAAWHALSDRGRRFADARDVAAGRRARPRLLVLPDPLALGADLRARIAGWIAEGTRVVADGPSPFDGDGRALPEEEATLPGVVVDPGFERLRALAEDALGPPLLRVRGRTVSPEPTSPPSRGGAASPPTDVPFEIGLYADGRRRYAVCVPIFPERTSDGGSADVTLPAGGIEAEVSFGDGRRRPLRDLWRGQDLGPLATATFRVDAGTPILLAWEE